MKPSDLHDAINLNSRLRSADELLQSFHQVATTVSFWNGRNRIEITLPAATALVFLNAERDRIRNELRALGVEV